MNDKTGFPIPVTIIDDWNRAEETGTRWCKLLDEIIEKVQEMLDRRDVIVAEIHDIADLKMARQSLARVIPYAVCTSCQGQVRDKCTFCRRRGFISQFLYETCVPIETRELRAKVCQQPS